MAPTTFTETLAHAAMLATQALPETLHARLADAVVLVRDGHCFQTDAGDWQVDSSETEGLTYRVNGQCSCHDFHYNKPERGLCKHRLSVFLSRKVAALMTVAQTGTEVPADPQAHEVAGNSRTPQAEVVTLGYNLPEARASVNVRLVVGGHEVLWTLRDHEEGRLAARLERLLAQYPAPQPPSAPASTQGEGWCARHQLQMKLNQKNGNQWFSHRLATGDYCKGK
jgi:hypothetical protein